MEPPTEAAEAVVSSEAAISSEAPGPSEEAMVSSKASLDEQLREELQDQVRKLIEPWRKASRRPPFNAEELVIMALVLKGPLSEHEVLRWIIRKFNRYMDNALSAIEWDPKWDSRSGKLPAKKCRDLQVQVHKAFGQHEVPLVAAPRQDGLSRSQYRWTVPGTAARIFLQDRLHPKSNSEESQKAFPFLRLPAELRNYIYELVLEYPKPGLVVRRHWNVRRGRSKKWSWQFDTSRRELDDEMTYPFAIPYFSCRSIRVCLALFLVSKQVFKEAMPIFYSGNNFVFNKPSNAIEILRATPEPRRKHIRHVSLQYESYDEAPVPGVFRLLKSMAGLRELDIDINEGPWKRMKNKDSSVKFPDVLKIPGIFTLRSIRGLNAVRFHGDCETFKTLVSEMTSEKKEKKTPVKRPRKRKVQADAEYVEPTEGTANDEDSQDQTEPPKKKARKPKKSKTT